jgi:phosphoribosylanthranilate isomerase
LTDTLLPSTGNTARDQPVQGFVGITGETSDWHTARELVVHTRIPVILAGGLSPENVEAGITTVQPAGVDSCTATNQVDSQGRPIRFRKDRSRVLRFVAAARQARSDLPTRKVTNSGAL